MVHTGRLPHLYNASGDPVNAIAILEDFMSDIGSITRRATLGGAALGVGAAALGGGDALAQAGARKTFVLIHGAYHGGWCWRKVVDILEKHGHKVYAPSLTGPPTARIF